MARKAYEPALKQLRVAREVSPPAQLAIIDKHIAQARDALASRHYELGVAAFRAGRYDTAVAELGKVLKHKPEHRKAKFYHANATALMEAK